MSTESSTVVRFRIRQKSLTSDIEFFIGSSYDTVEEAASALDYRVKKGFLPDNTDPVIVKITTETIRITTEEVQS